MPHLDEKETRKKENNESGFSLVELLIVIVIIGILTTISVLSITASRRAANGASAIQSVRVLSQCQVSYSAGVGEKNAATPQQLFDEDLIDTGLARACIPTPTGTSKGGYTAQPLEAKSGFFFDIIVDNVDRTKYTILARPIATSGVARTGDRTFFVDQTGVIRTSDSPTVLADASSQALE
jgi:type IV pilus assembly protein PilA